MRYDPVFQQELEDVQILPPVIRCGNEGGFAKRLQGEADTIVLGEFFGQPDHRARVFFEFFHVTGTDRYSLGRQWSP